MNRNYLLTLLVIWFLSGEIAQAKSAKKEIFIPAKSLKENKFNQLDGQFSYDYMAE